MAMNGKRPSRRSIYAAIALLENLPMPIEVSFKAGDLWLSFARIVDAAAWDTALGGNGQSYVNTDNNIYWRSKHGMKFLGAPVTVWAAEDYGVRERLAAEQRDMLKHVVSSEGAKQSLEGDDE